MFSLSQNSTSYAFMKGYRDACIINTKLDLYYYKGVVCWKVLDFNSEPFLLVKTLFKFNVQLGPAEVRHDTEHT
jgi:hypothetical protein